METGTGKTYVYIRTVLELFRHYGLRIFIVVVPSVAIRESVPAISKTSMAVSPAKAVLDTSVYLSFLRRGGDLHDLGFLMRPTLLYMSSVVFTELYAGARDRTTIRLLEKLYRTFDR